MSERIQNIVREVAKRAHPISAPAHEPPLVVCVLVEFGDDAVLDVAVAEVPFEDVATGEMTPEVLLGIQELAVADGA